MRRAVLVILWGSLISTPVFAQNLKKVCLAGTNEEAIVYNIKGAAALKMIGNLVKAGYERQIRRYPAVDEQRNYVLRTHVLINSEQVGCERMIDQAYDAPKTGAVSKQIKLSCWTAVGVNSRQEGLPGDCLDAL